MTDNMAPQIGLVGCGNWGGNILRDLLLLGSRVLVADISAESRNRALKQGVQQVFSCAGELPECDGYVVAVPIPDLAPVCAELLSREKPVFSEKTLCLSMESADELERLGGDRFIFAMHKWHYHPGIETLRQIARSGRIGELKELFSIRHGWVDDFHGGDVFWTMSVHDLTIVEHIFGFIPKEITLANVIRDASGVPVSLTAVLGTGPVANLCVNARHPVKVSGVSIHGDKGSAVLQFATDDHITIRDANGEVNMKIDTTFPLYLELKEFVAYLKGGEKPRCGLRAARAVTESLLDLRDKAITL